MLPMQFKINTNSATQEKTLDIPVVWGTIVVAIISAFTSFFTSYFTTEPELKVKKQIQLLEEQKFKLELLQHALQVENSQQRAQSLRMLVDLELLDYPKQGIEEFIKNPDTIPHWPPESSGKASPSVSGGEKSSTSK